MSAGVADGDGDTTETVGTLEVSPLDGPDVLKIEGLNVVDAIGATPMEGTAVADGVG